MIRTELTLKCVYLPWRGRTLTGGGQEGHEVPPPPAGEGQEAPEEPQQPPGPSTSRAG